MGQYNPENDPANYKNWTREVDPSTRQSSHLWTKIVPVDLTLASAGTAENLLLLAPGQPTVNLIDNPSFETDTPPTGYTASGSTLARSNTVAKYGTYSGRITPDNAAVGEGIYVSLGVWPTGKPLTVSVYLQDNAGSGNNARVRVYGVTSAAYLASGNTVTLSNVWQRSVATYVPAGTGATEELRVYVETVTQHGTVFYADGLQAEATANVTTYCDGAQGLFNEWDGTAHASTSRRYMGLREIRGFDLHCTRDIYLGYDVVASATLGEFKRAGTDWWEDHPVYLTKRLSVLNAVAGEQPRVYGRVWGV